MIKTTDRFVQCRFCWTAEFHQGRTWLAELSGWALSLQHALIEVTTARRIALQSVTVAGYVEILNSPFIVRIDSDGTWRLEQVPAEQLVPEVDSVEVAA